MGTNLALNYGNVSLDAVMAQGKKGIMVPDDDGYYQVPLGALDYVSESKEVWVAQGARELFKSSSILMEKITRGQCFAEWGHTKFEKGMAAEDYIMALANADRDRFVGVFNNMWLDTELASGIDHVNDNAVVVMGSVKPYGPMDNLLSESLQNPHQDTCFSVRGASYNKRMAGTTYRQLYSIFGYDLVPSPGHRLASKYNSPAMESRTFSKEELSLVYNAINVDEHSPATESARTDLADLLCAYDKEPLLRKEMLSLGSKDRALMW